MQRFITATSLVVSVCLVLACPVVGQDKTPRRTKVAPPRVPPKVNKPPPKRRSVAERVEEARRLSERVTRIFKLKHARALDTVSTVQTVIGARAIATADERSNSIVVAGSERELEIVAKLVEQLDAEAPDKAKQLTVRTYELRHRSSAEALQVIRDLFGPDKTEQTLWIATDDQAGNIIARGAPAELDALDEFVTEFDGARRAPETLILRIKHREAGEVFNLLGPFLAKQLVTVQLDNATQSILIRGLADRIQAVKNVVEQLDRPWPMLTLTCYFMKDDAPGKGDRTLPMSLAPAVQALGKYGFARPTLLTTVLIRCKANSSFDSSSGLTTATGELDVSVEGQARLDESGKIAHVDLVATVTPRQQPQPTTRRAPARGGGYGGGAGYGARQQRPAAFSVESVVTVPLGQYVVMAAAPCERVAPRLAVILHVDAPAPVRHPAAPATE